MPQTRVATVCATWRCGPARQVAILKSTASRAKEPSSHSAYPFSPRHDSDCPGFSHGRGDGKRLNESRMSPRPVAPIHRVAIVEDRQEVREKWADLLGQFEGFSCVCACSSGEEALRVIPPLRPDIVLMDIFLPGMSGIECTVRLKELLAESRVLILTASDDEEMVFPALEGGADGYLLKHSSPAELHHALLDVLHGGVPMTSGIARRVAGFFRRRGKAQHVPKMQQLEVPESSHGGKMRSVAAAFTRMFKRGEKRYTPHGEV